MHSAPPPRPSAGPAPRPHAELRCFEPLCGDAAPLDLPPSLERLIDLLSAR